MTTRPLTMLIWVAICTAVSLSYANATPESRNDGLSNENDGYRNNKKEAIQLLRKIFEDANIDSDGARKRACQWNLGGHCATENAVQMADQWNFLKSPKSPGRRRRRSSSSLSSSSSYSTGLGHLDNREEQLLPRENQRP